MRSIMCLIATAMFLLSVTSLHADSIVVTSLADDGGPGTLRAAIDTSNAGGPASIAFAGGLMGTITLRSNLPTITSSLTIVGHVDSAIAIDGNKQQFRPFLINAPGLAVTISDLTIRNCGDRSDGLSGGAIQLAAGNLTLDGCVLSGNSANWCPVDGGGGAIYIATRESATLTDCQLTGNSAFSDAPDIGSVGGGGILVGQYAKVNVTNCTLDANIGGGLYNYGIATFTNSSLTGVGAVNLGNAMFTDCTLSECNGYGLNNVGGTGLNLQGVADLSNCTLSANTGCGVDNLNGTVNLNDCTVSGNTDSGIASGEGTINLTGCTISGNSNGGILAYDSLDILTNCTVTGNTTGSGVGILGGSASLTNCTVTGNGTTGYGGGIDVDIGLPSSSCSLLNCIVYGNTATTDSEVYVYTNESHSSSCSAENCDIQGGVSAAGITDNGGNFDLPPLLDPAGLGDNGGPTQTIALLPGSPCLGAGNQAGAPATDQRGVARPKPPGAGAYDAAAPPLLMPAPAISPNGGAVSPGQPVTITDTVKGAAIYYTTDGTSPTTSSTQYAGPFAVASSEVVTAVAVESGYTVSVPTSVLFTVAGTSGGLLVTNLNDSGAGSLRGALAVANAVPGSTIKFQAGLSGTIALAGPLPPVIASVAIQGPGASTLAIDGAGQYRPFTINAPDGLVAISSLTVRNGSDKADNLGGGGIFEEAGSLTATGCTITGNTADFGGGVEVDGSTAILTNCTLSGNSTASYGGGIWVGVITTGGSLGGTGDGYSTQPGTATITDCTLVGNSALNGGGIYNSGLLTVTNCTLTGNSAPTLPGSVGGIPGVGGGICNEYSATITNCTMTGNAAGGEGGALANFNLCSITNCILYDDNAPTGSELESNNNDWTVSAGYCDIEGGVTGNAGVVDKGSNIDQNPLFDPAGLADNGGLTQTIALLSGSPCLRAGTAMGAPTVDQRGYVRPNPPSIGAWDDGTPFVPHTFPPGLAMISVPTDYSSQPLAAVLGYSSPTLAVWEPSAGTYAVTPSAPANALSVGLGYWIKFPASETVTTLGTAAPAAFTVPLAAGWNMIGCPQTSPLPVGSVSVVDSNGVSHTYAAATAGGLVGSTLFTYQAGDTAYEQIPSASGSLTPYEGYWLHASQACTLSFPTVQ